MALTHIGDASRHPSSEVAAGRPEHDKASSGHVFGTMIPGTLADSLETGVIDMSSPLGHRNWLVATILTIAPLFLTANRSPAIPLMKAYPELAP